MSVGCIIACPNFVTINEMAHFKLGSPDVSWYNVEVQTKQYGERERERETETETETEVIVQCA